MNEQCPVGCCPHEGTQDAGCPEDLPGAPLLERAAHLYTCQMLSTYKIAAVTGFNRRYISQLLQRAGIKVISSGPGRRLPRPTAEDERLNQIMVRLYQEHRMPYAQIAELAGMSEYAVLSRLRACDVRIRPRDRDSFEATNAASPDDLASL